jgi:hypothetical protein
MKKSIVFTAVLLMSSNAFAWGRRGHQMVAETAATVVSSEPQSEFMRAHSFDLAYYANVPDFIWKRPATYAMERNQHYINLEVFQREFAKQPEITKPWELSRKEFDAKFPGVEQDKGRAFWRVRELNDRLTKVTQELRDLKEATGPARQKLQEKWIVTAGAIGHYIGDLGMPLHLSENHDGQMTGQKGIHSYFEDVMVNQLYPGISAEVYKDAQKKWPQFKKQNADKTVLQLIADLGERSMKSAPKLLAMDKKMKRDQIAKNAEAYHSMIRERLTDSSLVLAEVYRRNLGFQFDDNKFYFFAGEPEYIAPGDGTTETPAIPKK